MIINADGAPHSKSELLWQNPLLELSFAAETIEVDTNVYPIFFVVMMENHGSGGRFFTSEVISEIRDSTQIVSFAYGTCVYWREVTVTDSGLAFSLASGMVDGRSVSDDVYSAVPYRIYGIHI